MFKQTREKGVRELSIFLQHPYLIIYISFVSMNSSLLISAMKNQQKVIASRGGENRGNEQFSTFLYPSHLTTQCENVKVVQ